MRRKYFIFAGVLLCLIGLGLGYYLYNKPRDSAAAVQTDRHVKAKELYLAFVKEEQAANAFYVNKVLDISGTVASVQQENGSTAILLTAGEDAAGGVNCSLAPGEEKHLPKAGDVVHIKGRCTGFIMDVSVVDAVVLRD